jgi:signal transduction histidine kinase
VNSYFNLKKLTKEEIEFLLVNLEKKIKFKGTSLEKYIKNKDIQINIPKLEDGQKLNLLSRFENFMMIPVYYENMYYGFFILGGNKSKVRELTEEEYKTLETCRDKFAYYLYSREKEISKDEKLRVKTISSFVNSITHELRTPVSSIIGFASLAKKKKEDFQKVELYLEHIIQEADKIIKLTEDIGIYSESTQKLSKKEKEKFLISQAIKDSLKKMERQLKQANIKTYLIIEEDVEINFYKEKVVTAFGNLIKNAMENCDYSKGERIITITIKGDKKIIIKDNGVGIPDHKLDEVTIPFYSSKMYGMGLGLTISKEIFEKIGYKLTLESENHKWTKIILEKE